MDGLKKYRNDIKKSAKVIAIKALEICDGNRLSAKIALQQGLAMIERNEVGVKGGKKKKEKKDA